MDFEDVLFPDFDDIAVPPEPNEDSDRGKEAEQSQVTGQYLNAEKNCEFAANLGCLRASPKNSRISQNFSIHRQLRSRRGLHRLVALATKLVTIRNDARKVLISSLRAYYWHQRKSPKI